MRQRLTMKKNLALMSLIFVFSTPSYAEQIWRCSSNEFHGDIEIQKDMKTGLLIQGEDDPVTPLEFSIEAVNDKGSAFHVSLENDQIRANGRLSPLTQQGYIALTMNHEKYTFVCELTQ